MNYAIKYINNQKEKLILENYKLDNKSNKNKMLLNIMIFIFDHIKIKKINLNMI